MLWCSWHTILPGKKGFESWSQSLMCVNTTFRLDNHTPSFSSSNNPPFLYHSHVRWIGYCTCVQLSVLLKIRIYWWHIYRLNCREYFRSSTLAVEEYDVQFDFQHQLWGHGWTKNSRSIFAGFRCFPLETLVLRISGLQRHRVCYWSYAE